jgi:hypothetical protein
MASYTQRSSNLLATKASFDQQVPLPDIPFRRNAPDSILLIPALSSCIPLVPPVCPNPSGTVSCTLSYTPHVTVSQNKASHSIIKSPLYHYIMYVHPASAVG